MNNEKNFNNNYNKFEIINNNKSYQYLPFEYCRIILIKIIKNIKGINVNKILIYKIKEYNPESNFNKANLTINNKILLLFWNFIFINLLGIVLTKKANNNKRILNDKLTINMKVIRQNKTKIINSKYIPNRVYINGIKSTIDKIGIISIEHEGIYNVSIEYDSKLVVIDKMFLDIETLVEVDFSNFDSSSVTSMKAMFLNCKNLQYINFEEFDTSSVNNMTSMFEGCSSLKSINLSSFNTTNVKYMDCMFKGCGSIKFINVTNFRTPNLRKIKEMFYGCSSLEYVDISNFDISGITDMSLMFCDCPSLTSINIKGIKADKLLNIYGLFKHCQSLKSLDLSDSDTSNVTNMSYLFAHCHSLFSLNLSSFITSKVKYMDYLFYDCVSLRYIDISNFRTNNVKNMESMFSQCRSLISIDISNFDLSNKNIQNLFYDCRSLTSIKLSKGNTIEGKIDNMFNGCASLPSLDFTDFDFSSVISMEKLFFDCRSLTSLDLSNKDASNVIKMNLMFGGCESLNFLNLTNFKTLSIKSIDSMFQGCISLKSLDLSGFNTSYVENMGNLFSKCINIPSFNLSNFNTSLVTEMNSMFEDCYSLISINISNFNTSRVINMNKMFYSCIALTTLDLSTFDFKKALYLENMFYNCPNLKFLNLYNFNNENILVIKDIFYSTDEKLVICINNKSNLTQLSSQLSYEQCITNECSFPNIKASKIVYDNRLCVEDCFKNDIYKYQYKDFCYDKCPKGTHSSKFNQYNCQINVFECIKEYPFLYPQANRCEKSCNCIDFLDDTCTINNFNLQSESTIINNIINGIQEGLLDDILEQVINEKKNDIIKILNNTVYEITSSFNQNFKDYVSVSSIKLGKCENILKEKNFIPYNETLLIFKTEVYKKDHLIPLIEYEIFNPETKEILDLEHCKNAGIDIDIYIPVTINNNIIFKYEPENPYYYDYCLSYNNENKIDLTLYDRKEEFNNNHLSLCINNCKFKKYDSINNKVICSCKIQKRISLFSDINIEDLEYKFENKKSLTNLEVLKCFKLLFSKEGFNKNIGTYLTLTIILAYISSAIYFYIKGYDLLCSQLDILLNENMCKEKNKKNCKSEIYFGEKINDKTSGIFSSKKAIKLTVDSKLSKYDLKTNSNDNDNNLSSDKFDKQEYRKNELKYKKYIDYEMNNLPYKEAIEFDKRTFFQYYISLIRQRNIIIFTFYSGNKDYNSFIIKVCLLFFYLVLNAVINILFFNDSAMHTIYIDNGKFNLIHMLPQIIYTLIIYSIIRNIVNKLSLSHTNLLEIKNEKNRYNLKGKAITIIKRLIIKYIFFFISTIFLLFLFWYYISCFCAVYKNTQIYVLKVILFGHLLLLFYQFIICLIPGIFRIPAIKKPGEYIYKLSQIIQFI